MSYDFQTVEYRINLGIVGAQQIVDAYMLMHSKSRSEKGVPAPWVLKHVSGNGELDVTVQKMLDWLKANGVDATLAKGE